MCGSIPAPAGEPDPLLGKVGVSEVYPRACGGTSGCPPLDCWAAGLSPRLRGNPPSSPPPHTRNKVYPRACGGTLDLAADLVDVVGLSPRLRGEPLRIGKRHGRARVYPRACGGTSRSTFSKSTVSGLSPRLRGNLDGKPIPTLMVGSIPAPAGEPTSPRSQGVAAQVYPRACGGTSSIWVISAAMSGLSPRLRGNRPFGWRRESRGGSIPAPAGEPTTPYRGIRRPWVYPRACGGTYNPVPWDTQALGLSPRLRGNHGPGSRRETVLGSIPAPAGEPLRYWPQSC